MKSLAVVGIAATLCFVGPLSFCSGGFTELDQFGSGVSFGAAWGDYDAGGDLDLEQKRPNPFGTLTTIRFAFGMDHSEQTVVLALDVYDVMGRHVLNLLRGTYPVGRHEAHWYGADHAGRQLSNTVYFYTLSIGRFRQTKQMQLVR